MSSKVDDSKREEIDAALQEAQKQGLPPSWNLVIDDKNRKKWISPPPDKKRFSSLDKAIEYANFRAISGTDRKQSANVSYNESKMSITSDVADNSDTKKKPSKRRSSSNNAGRKKKKIKASTNVSSSSGGQTSSRKRKISSSSSTSNANNVGSTQSSSSKEIKKSSHNEKGSSSSSKSSKNDEEYISDPEYSLDIPPDYDENSPSSAKKYNRCIGTVHWDPNSINGSKVGHRIRVHEFHDSKSGTWKQGRIVRYDPISHKHKVIFFGTNEDVEEDDEQWLMLKNENIQLGGEFVWALVKGFAWWPAQILHCHFGRKKPNSDVKDMTTQPVRDGYVLVEFFDSDEVAAIRNTADFLRPFRKGYVDEVVGKNKKKRNAKAVESGVQEEIATQEVRNDAAKFYAECAFKCANRKANFYLGMKVEILREDINYPVGLKLVGTVRQYSLTSKKWLVAYDPPPVNKEKHSPKWHNLNSRQLTYKVIDPIKGSKRKQYDPNDEDVFPYLFGYVDLDDTVGKKCRGCVGACTDDEIVIQCSSCKGFYHPGCIDPPMSTKTAENMIKSGEEWTCNKCARCVGCRELEIAFGTKTVTQPSSLFLEGNATLELCRSCTPMYEKKMFCPCCAHIWDDTRFQRIQKQARKLKKSRDTVSHEKEEEKKVEDSLFQWKSPSTIDDSWFYPEETEVWGYNEEAMLFCEECELWVHASCAGLTKSEYAQTNEGNHPIYSKEFLCRTCCKRKCLSLLNMLIQEDFMGLFAEPVTDAVAHNYSDVIKNPMDLQTMMQRAQEGAYRNYAWLRESFELMVLNALTFNIGYTTYWNEAKRFYDVCRSKVFKAEGKGAPRSKYVELIKERFLLADQAVQAEKDRVKADETTEKKDLVAGSQVLKVTLGPLAKPCDPPSCVPCFEVRLNPMEALYCSWMDTCFTCGSSGAADTMLFCVDCGEAYHSFCAMAPIHSMNEAAVNGWRCPNCKLCEIAGEVTNDELKLIYCEMCDRAFSIDRLDPPLEKVPSGLWICGQCVDCTKCNNAFDKGHVSRAYWSKDPSLCRGCGGCDEIIKPVAPKVSVKKEQSTKTKKVSKKIPKQVKAEAKPKKEKKKEEAKPKPRPKQKPKVVEKPQKTKEQLKEEALVTALKEAQSRGLPDGWTCFYGAANRKRWRSPPPNERVFDSIPKALQFVEKLKNGHQPSMKAKSRMHKPIANVPPFVLTRLCLEEKEEWINREQGYDDNTSLMSDGEAIHRILEHDIGVNFCELFDPSSKTISSSNELKNLPRWLYQRAARFARFLKRLPKRNQKQNPNKGIDHCSQMVVCKMASSFIFVICKIYQIDIKTYIKSHQKLESLLLPRDFPSGIVALDLPTEKTSRLTSNVSIVVENEKSPINSTPTSYSDPQQTLTETALTIMSVQNFPSNLLPSEPINNVIEHTEDSLNTIANPNTASTAEGSEAFSKKACQPALSTDTMSSAAQSIPRSKETISQKNSFSDSMRDNSEEKNLLHESTSETYRSSVLDKKSIDIKEKMSAQEFDIANALLGLTSPGRSRTSTSNVMTEIGTNQESQTSRNIPVEESLTINKMCNVDTEEVNNESYCQNEESQNNEETTIENKDEQEAQQDTHHEQDTQHDDTQQQDAQQQNAQQQQDAQGIDQKALEMEDVQHTKQDLQQIERITEEPMKVQHDNQNLLQEVKANDDNDLQKNLLAPITSEDMPKADLVESSDNHAHGDNEEENAQDSRNHTEDVIMEEVVKVDKNTINLPWLTSVHEKIEPMCGWPNATVSNQSSIQKWIDPRRCCLCGTSGDDDAGVDPLEICREVGSTEENGADLAKARGAGRLLPLPNGGWIHANCAVWSSEVWETPNGGFLNGLLKARGRGAKLKCFGCGRTGATLGCHKGNCMKNYHYTCARACGVIFMENHKLYCGPHKSSAKDSLRSDFTEPMKSLKAAVPKDMEPDSSLSIRCGSLVVHSLGQIQTEIDGFHSEHYIMPPGYTSTRIFWSYQKAKTRTLYFMKIERSSKNLPRFSLTTADLPNKTFSSNDVEKVYKEVMKMVLEINMPYFSDGDLFSIYPMKRKKKNGVKAFCLNGPQFWGFGVDNIRNALETQADAVACAVPLTEKSTPYRFCFKNPTEEAVTNLQRKRAAVNAEKALENLSGCARTEGLSAVDKSTSSGRITRALVRKVEEEDAQLLSSTGGDVCKVALNSSTKQNFESNQAKYMEMKKYPMEFRLEAKRSHIHGWGLFAKIFFPKHSMIAEYMGETIGQSIADKREKEYEVLGMGSCYMFRLDLHNIVDATQIGCMARFMNHCCAANAYAKVVTVNTNQGLEKKIVVFANQDIQVGTEITYDYKFPVEDGSLRCTCGAPNCIGRMN